MRNLLLFALCSAALAACGDDESDDPVFGDSPISDGYECATPQPASCDAVACGVDQSYQAYELACSTPSAPSYCSEVFQCVRSYYDCFVTACPSGTLVADADPQAQEACATTYNTCVTNATGG